MRIENKVSDMLDKTDHAALARQHASRVADKYIPATNRDVTRADNAPVGSVAIEQAKDTTRELQLFLKETPAITSPEECKAGDNWIERARINLATLEDERKPLVEPLNKELGEINGRYREPRQQLETLDKEIRRRVTIYKNKVEAARTAEAERLRREAEEAEARRQQAAAAAEDAIASVDVGVCDDAGAAIFEADQANREAGQIDRAASRAERSIAVRNASIVGGRAMAMRTVQVINIVDPAAAVKAMCAGGIPEKLLTALRQCAVAFEDAYGVLPDGVTRTTERRM